MGPRQRRRPRSGPRAGILAPLLVLLALLVGCAGHLIGPVGPGPEAPPDDLVTLRETGGIAGIDARLTVTRDGVARLTSGRRDRVRQLGPPDLRSLERALAGVDWWSTHRRSRPHPDEADALVRTLVHQRHSVVVEDDAPPSLQAVLGLLIPLMAEMGGPP